MPILSKTNQGKLVFYKGYQTLPDARAKRNACEVRTYDRVRIIIMNITRMEKTCTKNLKTQHLNYNFNEFQFVTISSFFRFNMLGRR